MLRFYLKSDSSAIEVETETVSGASSQSFVRFQRTKVILVNNIFWKFSETLINNIHIKLVIFNAFLQMKLSILNQGGHWNASSLFPVWSNRMINRMAWRDFYYSSYFDPELYLKVTFFLYHTGAVSCPRTQVNALQPEQRSWTHLPPTHLPHVDLCWTQQFTYFTVSLFYLDSFKKKFYLFIYLLIFLWDTCSFFFPCLFHYKVMWRPLFLYFWQPSLSSDNCLQKPETDSLRNRKDLQVILVSLFSVTCKM